MTYPHANTLREGPNVSHRRAIKPMLWGAIFASFLICTLYALEVL